MSDSRPYALDSEEEPRRLDRQAELAGLEDHLSRIPMKPDSKVLDAGCGSGSMTRLMAKRTARGHVTGVDLNGKYLDYAREVAQEEGIGNISFDTGDIFDLPFDDDSFDIVWSKYVLQWVNEPAKAVKEFKRVTRPGGHVVCCNFDNLLVYNYPVDEALQSDIESVISGLIDPYVGRKMYSMFLGEGMLDITVDIEADRIFTVIGKIDEERRRNMADQYTATLPQMTKIVGSQQKAESYIQRHLAYLDREDTISPCIPRVEFPRVGKSFCVEIADEFSERVQGLADRDSLGQDAGMLFFMGEARIPGF
ncbi:MAG: methyltransferase domain-containing protein, partial [Planctomycetes bacterium]|nr:methyltransferase domain-containing protein [Planctomycetota bacterium]